MWFNAFIVQSRIIYFGVGGGNFVRVEAGDIIT